MIELIAKNKICPLISQHALIRNCDASACMMWRWEKEEGGVGKPSQTVFLPTGEEWSCEKCMGTGKIYTQEHKFYTNTMRFEPCDECEGEGKGRKYAPSGYCGLAGIRGMNK